MKKDLKEKKKGGKNNLRRPRQEKEQDKGRLISFEREGKKE
jgi:hypothetical protein